jgi:rare lipoprotein A
LKTKNVVMPKKIKAGLLAYLFLPIAVFGRGERPLQDTIPQKSQHPPGGKRKSVEKVQYGVASWYSNKFEGRKTYTDEIFSQKKLTGASNTVPMHTWVRVTNLRNNRTVIVRINDKMHPRNKRLIDLSHAAAKKLGYAGRGLTRVKVEILGKKRPPEAGVEEVEAGPDQKVTADQEKKPS